jgi:antibiotic biosynthesis monooxygenase (ABM) superfamily enzyme
MPVGLLTVKTTITRDREQAFNEWYNQEHIPDLLKYEGAVSARRYRTIIGEDKFQYLALYEFESEEALRAFLESDHLKRLKQETEKHFGEVCERQRAAYVQVWP